MAIEVGGNGEEAGAPSQQSNASATEKKADDTKFMGVALRGWAMSAISAIAVLGAMGTASIKLMQQLQEHKVKDQALTITNQDLSKQINAVSRDTTQKLSEAEKHKKQRDTPREVTLSASGRGSLTAYYYESDGCLEISRTHGAQGLYGISDSQDLWIPDPSQQVAANSPAMGKPSPNISNQQAIKVLFDSQSIESAKRHPSHIDGRKLRVKTVAFQSSCLNPHPGTFQVTNTQVNACLIQVWRRFGDGCTHFQMYNACNGVWDPNIQWQFCANFHRW